MTAAYQLPSFLYTTRLRLDLLDYSKAHSDCLLGCLNSPTAHKSMGDFGVRTIDDLDKMLTGTSLRLPPNQGYVIDAPREIDHPGYDCYYLLRLGEGRSSCLIGAVSMSQRDEDLRPDIGWSLLEKYHGQGYATEAAKELLRFAQEDLHLNEIISLPGPTNVQSINVARRIGLVESEEVREEASGGLQVVYVLPSMLIEDTSLILAR